MDANQGKPPANIPDITVTTEGAAGGSDDAKKGIIRSIVKKVSGHGKRSKSKSPSPEAPKGEKLDKGGCSKEELKRAGHSPPAKMQLMNALNVVTQLLTPSRGKRGDEDMDNLCEGEVTEHAKTLLAPPEKDAGIDSITPSPMSELAEECQSYSKSSSISSAPSDYSTLSLSSALDNPFSPDDDRKDKLPN